MTSAHKPDLILTSPFLEDAEPILKKIGTTLKLSIFEKAGHNPMEEQPAATAAAVDAFLPAKLAPRPDPVVPPQPSDAATGGQVRPAVDPQKD